MTDGPPTVRRRALVVGAARGIGLATALRLSADGHDVTATWNRTPPPKTGAADLSWARCDTTDPASVDALFDGASDRPFEIVVANAAVLRDRLSSRLTDEDFAAVIDVNLLGTFRIARAALQPMVAARWGRVVLVSSVGGWIGIPGQASYAASKAGLLGMARSLASEVARRGVTVNVVAPGPITTELIEGMAPRLQDRFLDQAPAGRMGEPDEVAATIAYLASERSGAITGALVPVDGGVLA
ncbi:SDR family oxidoreductase [Aquihabitans daechungensis]|uniref:SDR family oxidoreductase n=1 Tax=Aquihabitans daechungensis TaxID=1052257 RepID=UPI003BA1915B